LAFATAVVPPSGIKENILDQIGDGKRDESKETKVIEISSTRRLSILRFAAAASIFAALTAGMMAYTYWKKWQKAEDRLVEMIAENARFAENYNYVNQRLEGLQQAVAIMNDKSFRRVVMAGTDNAPQAQATVYWNEQTADVYLSIQNLKELSKDQQYQLWAIIDGKPVDAGVFDPDTGSLLVKMKRIGSNAQAFAVTIEPRGGSENPSLETMQVLGSV
jgi:hypothetical protein